MQLESIGSSRRKELPRFVRVIGRRAKNVLPRSVGRQIARLLGRPEWFPMGAVRFGDLRRPSPFSRSWGAERGTPIDRHYIERFLAGNAADIRGRVLEIGDNAYTLRFGGASVDKSDILHVDASNPRATFVGDLSQPNVLPEAAFDCIVLTQVLQFIYDVRAAVATLHRALKPEGVLLLTAPGISQLYDEQWAHTWYWSLTTVAARRLLEEQFAPERVTIEAHGNVLAATAFLYGISAEELSQAELEANDAAYPVIVTARAVKQGVHRST